MNKEEMNDCIVGVQNKKDLEFTNMRFEMMIDDLNKSISNIGVSMNEKFDNLNEHIIKIDNKIDTLQESIPNVVDKQVEERLKTGVFNGLKWFIITIGGSVAVGVAIKVLVALIL